MSDRQVSRARPLADSQSLAEIGYKELRMAGAFVVPGFAKFFVIEKPATKARKGTNPFTGGDDVLSETGTQDSQGASGQSREGRGIKEGPVGGLMLSPM